MQFYRYICDCCYTCGECANYVRSF